MVTFRALHLISTGLLGKARAFRRGQSGQITIIFGLSLTSMVLATGAGIDLSVAYHTRQKLSEVATLACQYASRPSIIQYASPTYPGANGGTTYTSSVKAFITTALANQQMTLTQTNANPFIWTQNGAADVNLSANVPTAFMQLVQVTQVPVTASAHCYDSPPGIQQITPNGVSPFLVQEGFEANTCGSNCTSYYDIPGRSHATPSAIFVNSPAFTGTTGSSWYASGYCLETDSLGLISATLPEGTRAAELDCDNGSNSAGNSSVATKVYVPAGNYELRYNYRSRVSYPNYDPAYICGSTAADVSWANDTNSSGGPVANALRTNQMNVYFDLNSTGSPPLHTTIDGTQQLFGSNLIDVCVYSSTWVERSVRIYVTTPGYYWLSFAADGQNDSFGAQLDNIRLCIKTCPIALQDNFPASWLAANNGGVNEVLFRDTFESPVYSASCGGCTYNINGNLNTSLGTSGTSASGWPSQAASGWATAPYNQIDYNLGGAAQGAQFLDVDGTISGSQTTSNRVMSRGFLLDPGYYNIAYNYRGGYALNGVAGVYCGATPAAAGLNVSFPAGYDTNMMAVFMSHSDLVSYPIGGGALNSTTSYKNPNGTTTTTPTVPPSAINLTSFNASQPNALLDICGYATTWQSRSADFLITKPGIYYLTIASLGQGDNTGPQLDDVRLTALGSPYMAVPPSSPVTIPVPSPQPSAQTTFTGFYTIADPLMPPAPLQ